MLGARYCLRVSHWLQNVYEFVSKVLHEGGFQERVIVESTAAESCVCVNISEKVRYSINY